MMAKGIGVGSPFFFRGYLRSWRGLDEDLADDDENAVDVAEDTDDDLPLIPSGLDVIGISDYRYK